eukprot:Rhum_TRINITY_DN12515_c0_g2::Rhum_TRINITY_DN12515_c0_g2_i1::g.52493::m.52493
MPLPRGGGASAWSNRHHPPQPPPPPLPEDVAPHAAAPPAGGGAFCGECGALLARVAVCAATGEPHARMTLYSVLPPSPQRDTSGGGGGSAAEDTAAASPPNPLAAAFPSGTRDPDAPPASVRRPPAGDGGALRPGVSTAEEGGDGSGGGGEEGATSLGARVAEAVRRLRAWKQGRARAAEAEAQALPDGHLHREDCMALPYVTVARACLILMVLVLVFVGAAMGHGEWYTIKVSVGEGGGGESVTAMSLTYGFLQMCNTTLVGAEGGGSANGTAVSTCSKIRFDSPRCNTENTNVKAIAACALVLVMLVLVLVAIAGLVASLFRHTANRHLPAVCLAATLLATVCGVSSCGLFMTAMETKYCTYDVCELMSWEWLAESQPADGRTGTCGYGASLFLCWVASAMTLVSATLLFLFLLLHDNPISALLARS